MKQYTVVSQIGKIVVLLLIFAGIFKVFASSGGVLIFLLLASGLLCGLFILRESLLLIGKIQKKTLPTAWIGNLSLVICSVIAVLAVFEGYLRLKHQETATAGQEHLTMPEEWQLRETVVEGAKSASYWHGKLHVYNDAGMRRSTPFPPRKQDYCRIMVIGDSLTYGKGVASTDTYPHLIETRLSEHYRVEVLNLGICGVQSEDILKIVLAYTPHLQPDLILYGVCQNDFLESGEGQLSREQRNAWAIPLPDAFKHFLIERTLSGQFFEQRYDELLMRVGLRADFYANILRDVYQYQIRFTRDVTAMNFFVVQHGLPPIVAMVLDQAPERNGRGQKVTRLAETILQLVGMDVIPTEEYYRKYDGQVMKVSSWEGHPGEEAHKIFAEYFAQALIKHPVLQPYKK
ncbi:MAG: SGNH/GDSL hydrolase family protein [Candidatus Vecturithrix sp.]|jgi:hypothetical protein|nr:SGNH/GDSL hydrolase family protein [Candidatus Vecturithrix sp.]